MARQRRAGERFASKCIIFGETLGSSERESGLIRRAHLAPSEPSPLGEGHGLRTALLTTESSNSTGD